MQLFGGRISEKSEYQTETNHRVTQKPGTRTMLGRDFLTVYPVLALALGPKERDALMRHLPRSLLKGFIFAHHVKLMEMYWTPLASITEFKEGDTWIEIRTAQNSELCLRFELVSLNDTSDDFQYAVEHTWFSSSFALKRFCDIELWLVSLRDVYKYILIRVQILDLFTARGWRGINGQWTSPSTNYVCARISTPEGTLWEFRENGESHNRIVGFFLVDSGGQTVYHVIRCSYLDWTLNREWNSGSLILRHEWLELFSTQIQALSNL
jgi:hypothetical protein